MVNFRWVIGIGAIFIGLAQAQAQIPGLETAYDNLLTSTQDRIVSQNLTNGQSKTCHPQALEIRADGKIEITVAFGYMDVSGGQDFNDSGTSIYGNGHVLDIDAKNALKGVLKAACPSSKLKACGFRGNGDTLTKRIKDRWSNTNLNVTIRLASPSVTSYNSQNVGANAGRQNQSSANVRNIFLSALQTQDVTLYLGHARSGGGPDFMPPILTGGGHVNYPHYRKQQEGIGSMLSVLGKAQEPSSVVGVLACKSTDLFASRIRSKAPDSVLVTADALFDYNDILPTGYAIIEAVLSQRCSDEFTKLVKVQPKSKSFLDVFY